MNNSAHDHPAPSATVDTSIHMENSPFHQSKEVPRAPTLGEDIGQASFVLLVWASAGVLYWTLTRSKIQILLGMACALVVAICFEGFAYPLVIPSGLRFLGLVILLLGAVTYLIAKARKNLRSAEFG